MNPWQLISEFIGTEIASSPCFAGTCVHGLAEMVAKDGKRWPVVNQDGRGNDIMPDNRYPMQVFFLLNSGHSIRPDDEGYGENNQVAKGELSLVFIGTKNAFGASCSSIQADVEYSVLKAIPNTPFTASNQVFAVTVQSSSVSSRKAETLEKYWQGYEFQSRILDLIAFEINIELTGTVCLNCN